MTRRTRFAGPSAAVLAAVLTAGCEPPGGKPPVVAPPPTAAAGPADGFEESDVPPEPTGPTLGSVHVRWAARLEETGRDYRRWLAADPEDPPVTAAPPPRLRPLAAADGPAPLLPDRTPETLTQAGFEDRHHAFWTGELDRWAADRDLTGDERTLLYTAAASGLSDGEDRFPLIEQTAAAIREAGTADPLVAAHLAWERSIREATTAEVVAELDAAAEALLAADPPPLFAHRVTLWRLRASVPTDHPDADAHLEAAAEGLRAFGASLVPGAAPLTDAPQAPRFLYDAAYDVIALYPEGTAEEAGASRAATHLDVHPARVRVLEALSGAAAAGGDPYAFHCLAGDLYIAAAWDARGSAYAGSVDDDAWPVFERRIESARQHLHAAYLARPDLPLAPTGLITVGRAAGGDLSETDWFRRAVAGQIDYWGAFTNLNAALQPRWGGSLDRIAALAAETLREDLADTQVPTAGLEAVRVVADDVRDGHGAPSPGPWRLVLAGHARALAARAEAGRFAPADDRGPDARRIGALHRSLAAFGMDEARAAALRAWPAAAGDLRTELNGFRRAWVLGPLLAARPEVAGKPAARLAAAFAPDAGPVPADALPGLRDDLAATLAALDAAGADPAVAAWAAECGVLLDWLDAYHAGGWVDLPITPGLVGFRCGAGTVAVEDGTADLSGERRERPYLSPLATFPGPVLAAGEFDPKFDGYETREVGIGAGPGMWTEEKREELDGPPTGGNWFVVADPVVGRAQIAWLPLPFADYPRAAMLASGRPDWFPLQVMFRDGEAVGAVGGTVAPINATSGPTPLGPLRFGGAAYWNTNQRFRVRNLKVRRRPDFTFPPEFRGVPERLREADAPQTS